MSVIKERIQKTKLPIMMMIIAKARLSYSSLLPGRLMLVPANRDESKQIPAREMRIADARRIASEVL